LPPAQRRRTRPRPSRCLRLGQPRTAILDKAETEYGTKTPFQSIYTIEAIIKRADGDDMIAWFVASIMHAIQEDWGDNPKP
jgi:hypothetical protein